MLALGAFPPLARRAVRLAWVVGISGWLAFAAAVAGGPGDPASAAYEHLFVALLVVSACLCGLRALLVAEQRWTWALCAAAILSWAAAEIVDLHVIDGQAAPASPSIVDVLWLSYYGLSFVALLTLMKTSFDRFRTSLWIDATVGALAISAIGAALLLQPILAGTSAGASAVATTMAYPLIDVLIVGLLIGVFAVSNGRPGRVWLLLGGVWALHAVADGAYLYESARGTYAFGTPLDAAWPALLALVALAAWHKPAARIATPEHGRGGLAVTVGFTILGLSLLTYGHWREIEDVAVILATLTLVTAFVRTTLSFAKLRTLAIGRELSMENKYILDAAGEGIVGTDSGGRITFANPTAARMTGYEPDELVGRDLHSTLHHTRTDGTPYRLDACPMHASLQDGTIRHCDLDVYWRADGSSFGVEFTVTPIVDGARINGAVVVFRDISERREVERVKDQFTSVVSHELRTPLTSIRGSLGLLESGVLGPLPQKAERMIHIAVQNTDRLVRLINDILDLERLDADATHVREAPCDAAQLIARAAEAMLPAAVAADVTLSVDAAPAAFEADADGLIQTLTNLIGNAVKFSPAGGTVQISSQRCSDEVLFCVHDDGRGIPADKLETIFGRFQQIDSSDSRQSGGTGLGLAISRSIVEHHGGRIWATSVPGEGSTFSFVVPAAPDVADQYRPRNGGDRGSVLICDDNAAILEVTGTALEACGYRVILAQTGEQAIERAITERPDVILLDLLMPGVSGSQTMATLREHAETAEIPIVVLSVLPRCDEDMTRYACADWIEKPAAAATLFDALERAIGRQDDTFRVLVVERDPAVADILAALFARHGVASFASTDGPQTLELCAQVGPDLIVIDNELPDVDGVDIKQWLHSQPRLRSLPMAAYDADDVEEAERDRRSVGSVAQMLTKGQITPEEFQWRVMTLLARPRAHRADAGDDA